MSTLTEPVTIRLSLTNTPARKVPNGLWFDVLAVLRAHGLDPEAMEVVAAMNRIVRHTDVERGGRLRPDGSIDNDDLPDLGPSWYCRLHGQDMWTQEAKSEHDRWQRGDTGACAPPG